MEERSAVMDMGKRLVIGYRHGFQGSVVASCGLQDHEESGQEILDIFHGEVAPDLENDHHLAPQESWKTTSMHIII